MSGDALPDWPLPAVDGQRMKMLALLLDDPNPIHWDADAVRALGLGDRPVNQGPANLAYVMNMLHAALPTHRLVRLETRFLANVHAGDRVVAGGRVTARRAGEVDCEVWLDRHDPSGSTVTRVLSGTAVLCADQPAGGGH